jgi:hypothetical protein
LPAKKKPTEKVEPSPEEQTSDEPMYSSVRGAGLGTNLKDMMSKETQMHILRGISEFALAMDGMIPRSQMPEEAKRHAKAIKREMLLMLRSMIDAKLNDETSEIEQEPKLKKIEVE